MAKKNIGATLSLKDGNFFANLKKASSATDEFKKKLGLASNALKSHGKAADTIGTSLKSLAGKAAGVVAAYASFSKIKDFMSDAINLSNEQVNAEQRLQSVMQNVKGTTQANIDSIKSYAAELQGLTTIGDEVAITGASQLGTFQLQTSTIKKLMPALDDLAVAQYGVSVSADQMKSMANLVGKVMTGSTSALTRYGVVMDKSQENILKNGKEAEKAATLVKVLQQNFGGLAKAMAETPQGRIQQLNNAWGDMKEVIGAKVYPALTNLLTYATDKLPEVQTAFESVMNSVTPLMNWVTATAIPVLGGAAEGVIASAKRIFKSIKDALVSSKPSFESIIDSCIKIKDSVAGMFSGDAGGSAEKFINGTIPTVVSAFASIMDKIADVTSFISAHKNIFEPLTVGILGAVAAVKLISGVSTVVSIISELGGIVGIVKGLGGMLLGVLGPTGWVIAGIAAAVTAIAVVVYKNWDTIKKTAQNLWNSIKNIFGGIDQWFAEKWAAVSNAVSSALRPVVSLFAPLDEQIAGVFTGAWDLIKMQWGAVAPFFAAVWANIKTPLIAFKDLAVMAFKIVFENLKYGFNQVQAVAVFVFNTIKTQAVFAGKVLWEAVKLVWVFFKNGITDAVKLLTAVVGTVSGVFKAVKAVMTGDFSGAAEALKGIWSRWKDFFVSVVDGVKENFSAAGTFFTNVWGAAVEAVKSQFNNLSTFISTFWTNVKTAAVNIGTTVVNSIGSILKTAFNGIMTQFENTINGGIRLINGAIGIINAIPGVNITTINDVKLPRLATGGIVTESTVANVGEAGPEAVLPLGQLWSQMDRFAEKVSERKEEEAKPSVIEKIIINVNGSGMSADDVVNELMPKLKLAIANM